MPSTNRFFSSLDSYSVNNNGTAIASFLVGNPPKQKLKMVDDKNRFSSIGENKGSGKTKSPKKKKKKQKEKKKVAQCTTMAIPVFVAKLSNQKNYAIVDEQE